MAILEKFLPLLKSPEWAKAAQANNLVTYPVLAVKSSQSLPVVAYGFDQGDTIGYLQKNTYPSAIQKQLIERAIPSLNEELSSVNWQEIKLEHSGMMLRYLAFAGHFQAAECILLKERLQQAHSILNDKQLIACTPQRGMLLVFPYSQKDTLLFKVFADVCRENYEAGDNEAISPIFWLVLEGAIKDVFLPKEISLSPDYKKQKTDGNSHSSQIKIYTLTQIFLISLLGTLLAGILAIAANYKYLGLNSCYKKTLVASLFLAPVCAAIFVLIPRSPYDRLFPIVIAGVVTLTAAVLQKDKLDNAMKLGAVKQTVTRLIFLIISSLLLMFIILFFIVY